MKSDFIIFYCLYLTFYFKIIMEKTVFKDTKRHYEILDALRGIAALMVVIFHLFEIFSGGDHQKQIINHGYLAVDFFFVLSGFVIGYAYDDRWSKMTLKDFFKRRLIRLHPMIVMGMLIGGIAFYFSYSPNLFPGINNIPYWKLLLVTLVGFFLFPLPNSFDIRGWAEMYPTNGPAWSLFYEYVANIFYGLFLKKLSNKIIFILSAIAAVALIYLTIFGENGDVIGGWSLDAKQIQIGLTRLSYPFLAGLLVSRIFKPTSIKNAFLWCSLLVVFILAFPRIGGNYHWINGLYESLVIIFAFPLIVYMGASGEIKGKISRKIGNFLGEISYPIYIIHYPFIYIFSAYVVDKKPSMLEALPAALAVLFGSILVAYLSLKLYDIPVRKWLMKKYIKR